MEEKNKDIETIVDELSEQLLKQKVLEDENNKKRLIKIPLNLDSVQMKSEKGVQNGN